VAYAADFAVADFGFRAADFAADFVADFARRISRRTPRRTPFDHATDFAADFRRIFLRSKNLVNYMLKIIKKSDAKIRRVLHSLIRQAASSGVSAESDALFTQGGGVGVGGASCAPGLGSRPGCGGGFFRGGFFCGGFCGGVLILPCLILVQTVQSYALSPMPKIMFLEKLLAWLMRGFRRPSVIKHQTWLVSYLGYGGSYPMDYAMVMFQTSVCLASVLCHVSNFSKKVHA